MLFDLFVDITSNKIRDWLRKDVIVELWESRPRVLEKKNEDDSLSKEVQFQENGKPILDTSLKGILKIETSQWIFNNDLKYEDLDNNVRVFFFNENLL